MDWLKNYPGNAGYVQPGHCFYNQDACGAPLVVQDLCKRLGDF